jgi:hydroxymethylpyrimidine pyrophosphatase-like HAD family hydrolase
MNFFAIATDYDGTLAYDGRVRESTIRALKAVRESGRTLVLVSGRQLEELLDVFPEHDLFDRIVAEMAPCSTLRRLAKRGCLRSPAPPSPLDTLLQRGVQNVASGRAIVATWRPHECTVLEALRDLGLDRQIIFNKNAGMILPSGVNKASGLTAALEELKISHHNVVSIGDA